MVFLHLRFWLHEILRLKLSLYRSRQFWGLDLGRILSNRSWNSIFRINSSWLCGLQEETGCKIKIDSDKNDTSTESRNVVLQGPPDQIPIAEARITFQNCQPWTLICGYSTVPSHLSISLLQLDSVMELTRTSAKGELIIWSSKISGTCSFQKAWSWFPPPKTPSLALGGEGAWWAPSAPEIVFLYQNSKFSKSKKYFFTFSNLFFIISPKTSKRPSERCARSRNVHAGPWPRVYARTGPWVYGSHCTSNSLNFSDALTTHNLRIVFGAPELLVLLGTLSQSSWNVQWCGREVLWRALDRLWSSRCLNRTFRNWWQGINRVHFARNEQFLLRGTLRDPNVWPLGKSGNSIDGAVIRGIRQQTGILKMLHFWKNKISKNMLDFFLKIIFFVSFCEARSSLCQDSHGITSEKSS